MKKAIIRGIRFFFSKKEEPYFSLKNILGFSPIDISYYKLALIHKSAHVQDHGHHLNNERLEYLGDSVLGTVVADILYNKYPQKREGELTNIRSRIVQRMSLDKLATAIGLDRLIRIDRKSTQNFAKVHINGNAFEALMGAIYLDRGYSKSKQFIQKLIEEGYINLDQTAKKDANFKSKLIEWAQRERVAFEFVTDGEDFNKEKNVTVFHTTLYLQGIKAGEGSGLNKKESQQDAAHKALKALKGKTLKENIEKAAAAAAQSDETEHSTSEQTDIQPS